MRSVLQDWVMDLPLRAQGGILTGIRGCDVAPKAMGNEDTTERRLVAFFRWCVMNPADPREIDIQPGCFFLSAPPSEWRPSELGHYPLHWVIHLMHCFEIVAYCHPSAYTKDVAFEIYERMVHSLHLQAESANQMMTRLTEDRIASGTVVS